MEMELRPTSYRCADHDEDLTMAVLEQLEDRVPVAFSRRRQRPFAVIVRCPGGESGHRLRFEGEIVSSQDHGAR
jgi:hypothetical protein